MLVRRVGLVVAVAVAAVVHLPTVVGQPPATSAWQSASTTPATRYLPPAPVQPGRYVLGVQVRNTPTGVEVLAVQPGSAAARAGLEVGDVIITVGGQQVGLVDGRLYDIGDEVARRTAGDAVTLVARNYRTGGLVPIAVQFGPTPARAIIGQATARQNLPVSRAAVLVVRLLDVTQPQWRDVAVMQEQVPVGRFPVTFRLNVPPLAPGHRYVLMGRVDDGGQTILRMPTSLPIAPFEGELRIDLVLDPVQPSGGTVVRPRDQIDRWIRAYLGRPPRPFEVENWLADLQRGRTLTDVQAGILASTELFERQRRNPDLYVAEVHRLLTGRQPTPADMAFLRGRYNAALGVRLRFVEGLLQQPR